MNEFVGWLIFISMAQFVILWAMIWYLVGRSDAEKKLSIKKGARESP